MTNTHNKSNSLNSKYGEEGSKMNIGRGGGVFSSFVSHLQCDAPLWALDQMADPGVSPLWKIKTLCVDVNLWSMMFQRECSSPGCCQQKFLYQWGPQYVPSASMYGADQFHWGEKIPHTGWTHAMKELYVITII